MWKRGVLLAMLAMVVVAGCDPLPNRDPVGPVEIQRPEFLGVQSPATGAIEVPVTSPIIFTFSELVDASTAYGALSVSFLGQEAAGTFANTGSTVVDSTVSDTVDGQPVYTYTSEYYLTFTPSANLEPSARYSIQVLGEIKDQHGNSLSIDPEYGDSSWFFTAGDYDDGGWYRTYVVEQLTNELLDFTTPDTTVSQVTGLETAKDVAISDDGQYVIVSNRITSGYVSIFDNNLATRTDVTVGSGPDVIVTTGNYAFVVNSSSNTISTLDLSAKTESSVLSFTDGFDPGLMVMDADNNRIIVASSASAAPEILKVLSIGGNGTLTEASTIDFSASVTMGRAASGLAVYNDEAFVQEDLSSKIHIISLTSDAYEESFDVFLSEIADGDTTISGDRSRGLIAYGGTAYMWSLEGILYQVDLSTRTLIQHITLDSRPWDISFTPQGDLVYISLASDNKIEVYEPNYLTKLAEAPTTSGSRAIAVGRVK